ncbi:TonB-system energizer ExbB [Desulfogranum japonicum]|uniref:TonB-system energizer ExbB n=1 Tax=Desulfogranum japonicum TaxID=231447 RepID=UPI00042574A0|nr:TonB-system energizer ExbB [Desulfogranum japonicum]
MDMLEQYVEYGIIGILGSASVAALALALDRYFVFRQTDPLHFQDKRELELHLTSKLHLLATIGVNAPYVGLLGTVLGIMCTFLSMGRSGFETSEIMIGLALSLKATALGLVVAIPSVIFYNLLLRRVKVMLLQWDIAHG